jgi:hypothetical protein
MSKKSIETFQPPSQYEETRLRQAVPHVWSGTVLFRKYLVTVEEISEPAGVLAERLTKLWRESDNTHHIQPLKAAAKELGITLNSNDYAKDKNRKK